MDINARLEKARAARAAAKEAITPEIVANEAKLSEAEALEAETREDEARKRKVELAERLARAEDRYPDETLGIVDAETSAPGAGSYIVRRAPKADRVAWERAQVKHPNDTEKHRVLLAAKCVVDFNGTLRGNAEESAALEAEMFACWLDFNMVPLSITNKAYFLAGFVIDTDKS